MGQQLSIPDSFNNTRSGFLYPPWYISDYDVTPKVIKACSNSLEMVTSGTADVYKRVQSMYQEVTPLNFFYNQLIQRVFIICPTFIRNNLKSEETQITSFRAKDIVKTSFASNLLNDAIINVLSKFLSCTTQESINKAAIESMKYLNERYGVDANMYADLETVLLLVLSDCIGEGFDAYCSSWVNYSSKCLAVLIELKLCNDSYHTFSLRETMLTLHQPYIEWSDGILSTGYQSVDRQHQWLVTIINVLIHVNSNNTLHISIADVIDALFDYACIHFTEEERIFMNNPNYPQCEIHKQQHQEFLQKLSGVKEEFGVKDDSVISKDILDYSIAWLTNHIRVTDRKMINCCIPIDILKKSNGLYCNNSIM